MSRQSSFLLKPLLGLSVCLGLCAGLFAQVAPKAPNRNMARGFVNNSASGAARGSSASVIPNSTVIPCNTLTGIDLCINGSLGPVISSGISGGNYQSGLTATGSSGQTCEIGFTNGGGSSGTATVPLSGTNTISPNAKLTIINPGSGYTTLPTTASVIAGGTATCTGTATVTTTWDPLTLNNTSFTATTTINPDNVVYNANSTTYSNLTVSIGDGVLPGGSLTCTGAVGVLTVNDASDGGNDTFKLSNCSFDVLIQEGFTATVAFPPNSIPAPIPLAFGASIISLPDTASEATYTLIPPSPGLPGSTTLGIKGGVTATCTNCPSGSVSPTTLTFNASAGGAAPPTQAVTPTTSDSSVLAYAVTTSTTSGGNWLTVNGASTSGGDTPTPFNVGISATVLATLAPGTYSGTVTLFDATCPTTSCTAPVVEKVTVTLIVSTASFTLNQPGPLTFNSVNGSTPATQTVTVATTPAEAVPFTATPTSTGGWLGVSPVSGTTGSTVTVSADPSKTNPGANSGTIALNATGASNNPVNVSVTLNDTTIPTPAALTFNATAGGSNPASQPLVVTASGPNVTYTVAASGGSWLSVSSGTFTTNSGTSPSVSVNITGLAANTYHGTLTITPAFGAPIQVAVTLNVTSLPTLSVTGGPLSFSMVQLGSVPAAQNLSVTSSPTNVSFTAAVTSGNTWLSVSPTSGTTPGTLSVSILPNSMTPGTYNGNVQVTSSGASNSPINVAVTLTVTTAPTLVVPGTPLSFSYLIGGSNPASQPLSVTSSGAALSFTAAAASTGSNWLTVSPTSGTTPSTLTVGTNQTELNKLAAGPYTGTITITSAQAGNSPVVVQVNLTVSSQPSLVAAPPSLTFNYTVNGTVPGSQTTTISSNGSALSGVTATPNQNWLSVSAGGSTTPVVLTVSLVQANLPTTAGTYNATIAVSATGAAATLNFPVTLVVAGQASISASPTSLTFSGQAGGSNPPAQNVALTVANGPVSFTVAPSTTGGGSWLSVTPTSGTTSTTLVVSVNTTGLASGPYTGSITVTASGATGSPLVIPVSLTIAANTLTGTPNPINLSYTLGGTVPTQSLSVTSAVSGLTFTATSGAPWLTVTPTGGTTPATLSVSIVTTGLTAQTYNSSITLAATGVPSVVIPVTLTVSSQPLLQASPTTLTFNYAIGETVPSTQLVKVTTSNNAVANYTATVSTTGSGNWLTVSPASGVTPANLSVGLSAAALTVAGTYTGTVTIAANGFASTTVAVTVVVTQPQFVLKVTGNATFSLANTAAPATSVLTVTASDGSAQAFTVTGTPTIYNWLSFAPTSGTTPGTVTLTANPAGLLPGVYPEQLIFKSGSSTVTVQAQLTVTGSNLAANPSMLTFTYQPGITATPQTVTISPSNGPGPVPIASVTADQPWITVTSLASAPGTIQVSVAPGNLAAGNYSGDVIVKGQGAPTASLVIPVTLTINAEPALTVTPTTLTFSYNLGGSVPAAQSVAISTGNAQLNFTTTSPGSWVVLTPSHGTTPATMMVSVNPTGLPPGTYSGTIGITANGATNTGAVAVTLTVVGPTQLTIGPSSLTFAAGAGGTAPSQTLALTSNNGPLGFTAAAGSLWLSVTPTAGTTPATLTVSVNTAGLANGTYQGTINVTPAGSAVPQMVIVTLTVGPVTTPTIGGLINAASGATGKVSPGMAVAIFGSNLGPATGVGFTLPSDGSPIATTLAGTQVLFDGVPAPMLYSSSGQANAIAPFGLVNPNTVVTVVYNGVTSAGENLVVVPAEPGLFAANGAGTGQGAILNQDFSINSSSNPAHVGDTVMLFGTGGGLTNPASTDGTLNPVTTTGALDLTTTATVGGAAATVAYAGPAPGLLAGIIQVNVTIPAGTASGDVPVVIQINNLNSQTVTVAVQ